MTTTRPLAALSVCVLVLAGGTAWAAPTPQDPYLFSRPAYPTLVQPTSAALADLDGDGRMDVVATVGINSVSWGLSVMPGRERGFGRATLTPSGQSLTGAQVVDADGDGLPDVVASHPLGGGDHTGVAFPGGGDGTFDGPSDLPFPIYHHVEVGRFAASGSRPGAVVATGGGLTYWRPALSSGFGYAEDTALLPGTFSDLQAVDLDGDGRDELAGISGDRVHLVRDLSPVGSVTLAGVTALDAADVTGDGTPELLATTASGEIRAYDAALTVVRSAPAGQPGVAATAGDLNGDGAIDLVRVNQTSSLTVHWSGGGKAEVSLARTALGAFVGDATGDGHPDLMAVQTASSIVEVVEGDGAGGFAPQRALFGTQPNGWYVRTADFNRDGKLDALAGQLNGILEGYAVLSTATALLGNGAGGFAPGGAVSTQGSTTGIDVGDVNGDGNPDVVVADYHSGTVSQYFGMGNGSFQPRIPVPGTCELNDGLVAGDFNGDEYADVAGVCRATIFRQHLSIFLGSPAGLLPGTQLLLSNNAQAYVLRTGDVNGDGNQDIAIGSVDIYPLRPDCLPSCLPTNAGRGVGVFLGQGNGLFHPVPVDHAVGRTFVDIWVEDVNGDGRDDVVVPLTFDDEVEIVLGRADGTLAPGYTVPAFEYPLGVTVADVTGDGRPDLVMDHGPTMISVAPGLGDGLFGEAHGYATRGATGEARVGDFTGDGRPDVFVPQGGVGELLVQGA